MTRLKSKNKKFVDMLVNQFLFSEHYQDDVHFFMNLGLIRFSEMGTLFCLVVVLKPSPFL